MATVYNIKIKTVSPFCNYPEEELKEIFTKFMDAVKDEETGNKFESTEIEVKRIA